MTTRDLLKLSTRMFKARRGRTFLTILGMGIGFGAILFLVSLGYGLQNALLETITTSGALISLDVTPNEQDGKFLSKSLADDISKIKGVEKVEFGYSFSARVKYEEMVLDARAVAASPGFLTLEGLKISTGDNLEGEGKKILVTSAFGKILGKSPEELVGKKVAFSLFFPSDSKSIDENDSSQNSIEADNYEIAGVVENEETLFWLISANLLIPENIKYAKLKVRCSSSEMLDKVKDEISQMGFPVSSLSETVAEVNKMFNVINIVLGLFGIITLVVSAIGMFNTMTVALLERTKEIGIMRSIGASKMDIMLMFIIESTLMGFCGGVIGVILGIASGQFVNLFVNMAARYMGGKPLDLFSYPLWFLGFVLAFSIIIGFATGVGPAKRASSLDPLDALRSR